MTYQSLTERARTKTNFETVQDYLKFASDVLSKKSEFLQAEIICQNEIDYRFWQLPMEANFAISRPLNSVLLSTVSEIKEFNDSFVPEIGRREFMQSLGETERSLLRRVLYTTQQMIGICLDGLPANESNFARKLNGDLFERFMQLWFRAQGVQCSSAVVRVPVMVDGVKQCDMNFQHDLVLKYDNAVKVIGSVKTSSKDRIGKIFFDKLLLSSLTGEDIPHIAIFLNDVQRGRKTERSYRVSSTFLPGHFKAYSIKLIPLDGVYYCDLRPNMISAPMLKARISSIDRLFCDEIWTFLDSVGDTPVEVVQDEGLA